MCGRLNLRATPAELIEVFALLRCPDFSARYNVAPTQKLLSIRAGREGRVADWLHWGLIPGWSRDAVGKAPLINARAETAAEKPAFRKAFRERRCLIPASGYYEWSPHTGDPKQPWHITPTQSPLLAFAGLWESWQAPDGSIVESAAILTVSANSMMSELHDRMPAILGPDDWSLWIDPLGVDISRLQGLLRPCPNDWLVCEPVSAWVNNVRHEGPECLATAPRQGRLFD